MSPRLWAIAGAPTLAVLLAACPAAAPQAGDATGTSAGGGTMEEAAAAYERLADEFNERNSELNAELNDAQTLEEAQEVLSEFAELDQTFAAGLGEITFPEELREEVAALRAANEAHLALTEQLIAAANDEEYFAILQESGPVFEAVTDTANAVREELGLGPAPTP